MYESGVGVVVEENMFVNQGEEAFGEGEKAKITVKPTKTRVKAYAKATVFLVLRMEKRLLRSVARFPPPMGTYFVASAMDWRLKGCVCCHYLCGRTQKR